MRIRVTDRPPTQKEIGDLLRDGAPPNDQRRVVRRLQQSCYLNDENRPLDAKERLLAQYRKDGLVLFLGAGISCNSRIPSWSCLIKRLLPEVGITDDYETVDRTFPALASQFDLAAYRLGSPFEFCKKLWHCLYRDLRFQSLLSSIPKSSEAEEKWGLWEEVVAHLSANETLKAVGELLILENCSKLERNPQIHAVLTTNVDNLLEIYCRARTAGKSRILTMVDRASVGDHPNTTPVYHLHGGLDARGENIVRTDRPRDEVRTQELQDVDGDLLPDLVFRESEYYRSIANPVSFVNHAPQSYLQRLNVLFVGTSLEDLNIRRWLYNSFCERVQHRTKYLREYHCRVYKDVAYEAELASVRHFWLRTRTENGLPVPTDLVDLSANNLGIQVIWCNDYGEVHCLDELRQKGGVANFGR